MTKEQIYAQQLKTLGIYDPAFEPEIKALAQLERDETRARKAWSATAPPGGKPSLLDPHFAVIVGLRREILAHREALGLTPKALKKLRGGSGTAGPSDQELISASLDRIAARVGAYDGAPALPTPEAAYAAAVGQEWADLVSDMDTETKEAEI